MTLELTAGGRIHHVTVPRYADIRVGTLNAIIGDVAEFHFLPRRTRHALRLTTDDVRRGC